MRNKKVKKKKGMKKSICIAQWKKEHNKRVKVIHIYIEVEKRKK